MNGHATFYAIPRTAPIRCILYTVGRSIVYGPPHFI